MVHACNFSSLRRLRQEDLKFKVSLGYKGRPCLKKTKTEQQQQQQQQNHSPHNANSAVRFICCGSHTLGDVGQAGFFTRDNSAIYACAIVRFE
jgi:hypothetical protein